MCVVIILNTVRDDHCIVCFQSSLAFIILATSRIHLCAPWNTKCDDEWDVFFVTSNDKKHSNTNAMFHFTDN